jgi:hypothetical protein
VPHGRAEDTHAERADERVAERLEARAVDERRGRAAERVDEQLVGEDLGQRTSGARSRALTGPDAQRRAECAMVAYTKIV